MKTIPGILSFGRCLIVLALLSGAVPEGRTADVANAPILTLDLGKQGVPVSPMLYGLMTEEINYSYDGGLYAELIRNRSFKDDPKEPQAWSLLKGDGADAAMTLDAAHPVNAALPICLKLEVRTAGKAGTGVSNEGWWGMPVRPAAVYRASFYASADGGFHGPLTVRIESNDGKTIFAEGKVAAVSSQWKRYEVTLKTASNFQPSKENRFVIRVSQPGTVYFNLVSLFPPTYHNRPNGLRPDLMEILAAMKPKFLRFPGGNYLEGDTVATRFQWKNTLGDISQRPGHMGCWRYRSSDGLGLLEFLEWCEDLKMEPVLGVYAGFSFKEKVAPGPALQPFVEEALEEIEYVMDGVNTKWGARRAKDGHPEPFKLRYVEIGNEDFFDHSGSYKERFIQFYKAIKAVHPGLQIISTVGGGEGAGRNSLVGCRPDMVDEHYYCGSMKMRSMADLFDGYKTSGPKIFVGEWASSGGGPPTTNLDAALGDAAWMTGMERNADVVRMSCYAPLFVNVNPGGMQWKNNLIGYDALTCYGSPSYYAQAMFNTYLGDTVVPVAPRNIPTQTWYPRPPQKERPAPLPKQVPTLFFSATRDAAKGQVYLKLVNSGSAAQPVQIKLNGAGTVAPQGVMAVLTSAKPSDTNSITEPRKVTPKTETINGIAPEFTRTLPPYSISVLQMDVH